MSGKNDEFDSRLIDYLSKLINATPKDELFKDIGDGLNRDALLEIMLSVYQEDLQGTPEVAEKAQAAIAEIESLFQNQPSFRLEITGNDSIDLVRTLGNRVVYQWVLKSAIDEELISMLGANLRATVKQTLESPGGQSSLDVMISEVQSLPSPDGGPIIERLRRTLRTLRPRGRAINALKDRIGTGKSRDELLEITLPTLSEQMQETLAKLMNEQPPFRMVCNDESGVDLVLITNGEPVATWSDGDLGLPRPLSWRRIVYPLLGLYSIFALFSAPDFVNWGEAILGSTSWLQIVAMFDGFFFLRRAKGQKIAWRAYWGVAFALLFLSYLFLTGASEVLGILCLLYGVSLIGLRLGYIFIWYKLFAARDIMECPNCSSLITRRDWVKDLNYRCIGCGTRQEPYFTGQRASIFGSIN